MMSNVCQIFVCITLDTLDNMAYTLDMHSPNIGHKSVEVIMARAMAEKTRVEQPENYGVSSVIQHQSTCSRCGGLMVSDYCTDLLSSTGELEFSAKRCVQCGEVVDPIILRNRRTRHELILEPPAHEQTKSFTSRGVVQ